ncbi:collagen alpha-1(I) chain-like [Drosophila ananassae]|uniref:collagen alpha-1(I) chain-like n=1 Tax=Drosophila ananassae TaxID=7217 RepID=UPI001CFF9455|nr:collagen alpha-1(I) chain-like [Drosophila ananassae]
MGRPAAPIDEEGPPGDGPGGQCSYGDPGGQSKNGGGGPPAEPGTSSAEEEEEPGPEEGGRYPGAGKGAEGGGDRGGAVDERSMGVASPEGEAGAGEASLLPGEEAAEAGAPKGRVGRRWRSSARAELAAGAKEEGGGRGPEEEGKAGQVEHYLADRARKFSGARRPERDTRHPEAIE